MDDRVAFKRRLVVAVLAMAVGGVGFGVYALRVDEIRVTGVQTIDPRRVIEASGLKGGERILWIRLSSIARRIERLPAVDSVTAERSFPQTIVLRVRERIPLARLSGPSIVAVDAKGRMFAATDATLPIVEGWRGEAKLGATVDRASTAVLRAFADFPHELRRRTARIIVGPPLTLVLTDGTEVRFGSHAELVRKARVAQAVLASEGGKELAYVDVRAPGVPVSRKREPPTPAPTPRRAAATARPATPSPSPVPPATPAVSAAP